MKDIISAQHCNDYKLVKIINSHSVVNQQIRIQILYYIIYIIKIQQILILDNKILLKMETIYTFYWKQHFIQTRFSLSRSQWVRIKKGNFIEILEIFASEDIKLLLQARFGHYTSPAYQNDFISIIATLTRQNILSAMNKFGVYTIMVDETKYLSKKEQMSFLLRFVDKDLNICEKSIGCYHMMDSIAKSLANEIMKILKTNKLDKINCIGQYYDGALIMSGKYSGVQERIRLEVSHAIYVHCYAHQFNLCFVKTPKYTIYL